jgi:hypothetical protein
MTGNRAGRIVVFGDRVRDEYILPLARRGGYGMSSGASADWENHDQWIRMSREGGVLMTRDMLRWHYADEDIVVAEATNGLSALTSLARLGHCDICADSGRPSSFRPVDVTIKHNPKKLTLRVESFEGYFRDEHSSGSSNISFSLPETPAQVDAVVINDAGTDLRRSKDNRNNAFPSIMKGLKDGQTDVLMKMHLPLAQGLAWKLFTQANARARIVIVSAEDLRFSSENDPDLCGTPISRCPSWDRVVEDLHAAFKGGKGLLSTLTEGSDALVVMFDVEGAAILQGSSGEPKITLVFDPMRAEGEMARHLPGDMVGKMNCFLASFTSEFVERKGKSVGTEATAALTNDLTNATARALLDARLYGESHFLVKENEDKDLTPDYPSVQALRKADKKRKRGAKPGHGHPTYEVLTPTFTGEDAELLASSVKAAPSKVVDGDPFVSLAHRIVLDGVEATLGAVPHGRFGKLWTVDRQEIEGLRAVKSLIKSYLDDTADSKPLSIAVFGPPGAGKSFGVKQLVDKKVTPILEFNLSQVEEEQLPGFFHMIRDCNLKSKTPLCFFDEFDSKNLSLLKNFLAPMQDGMFLEGQTLRPVGRGIFVFAGGTSESLAEFEADLGDLPERDGLSDPEWQARVEAFETAKKHAKQAKKADFISRLRGSYDVKGPNPSGPQDPAHHLRRAILLRRMIEAHLPGIISQLDGKASIEMELLTALIKVDKYRHGTRSMELLVRALARSNSGASVGRSDLPIEAQIGMLVHLKSWKDTLQGPDA